MEFWTQYRVLRDKKVYILFTKFERKLIFSKQDEVMGEHAGSIQGNTPRNVILFYLEFFIYLSRKPLLSNLGKNSNLKDDCIWCLLLCDTFLKVISD